MSNWDTSQDAPAEYQSPPPPPPPEAPKKAPVDASNFDPDAFLKGGAVEKPWDPLSPSSIAEQATNFARGFDQSLVQTGKAVIPQRLQDLTPAFISNFIKREGWDRPPSGTAENLGAGTGRAVQAYTGARYLPVIGEALGAGDALFAPLGKLAGQTAEAGVMGAAISPDEAKDNAKWAMEMAPLLGLTGQAALRFQNHPLAKRIFGHAINMAIGALGGEHFGQGIPGALTGLAGSKSRFGWVGHYIADKLPELFGKAVEKAGPEISGAAGPALRNVTPPDVGGAARSPSDTFDPDAFLRSGGNAAPPPSPPPPPPPPPRSPPPAPPAAGPWKPAPPPPLTLPE